MKKNLFYLFALICSMGLFTACSDDDDDKSCPVPQTEFTAANGLKLNYNGEQMLGKKVTFTPDASDPTKATLILSGNLDSKDPSEGSEDSSLVHWILFCLSFPLSFLYSNEILGSTILYTISLIRFITTMSVARKIVVPIIIG